MLQVDVHYGESERCTKSHAQDAAKWKLEDGHGDEKETNIVYCG